MQEEINQTYGRKIRVRCCGILVRDKKMLMVRHEGLGKAGYYWDFPGGGAEKGETLSDTLIREYEEETHLKVSIKKPLIFNEFIGLPLHALELYFQIEALETTASLGTDPELNILSELKWFDFTELQQMPAETRPSFIDKFSCLDELLNTDTKTSFV